MPRNNHPLTVTAAAGQCPAMRLDFPVSLLVTVTEVSLTWSWDHLELKWRGSAQNTGCWLVETSTTYVSVRGDHECFL